MTPEELKALKREARKKGTSAARLLELAGLGPELSREVAKSENTPPEILAQLAQSADAGTLQRVAANPHTPSQTLATLAKRSNTKIVLNVACNKSTPETILRQLSDHPKQNIRRGVTANAAAPLDLLLKLRAENDHLVYGALKTLVQYGDNSPAPNLDFSEDQLLRAVALTDLIPAGTALRLAQHPSPEIRQALAENVDKIALSVRPQFLKGATP